MKTEGAARLSPTKFSPEGLFFNTRKAQTGKKMKKLLPVDDDYLLLDYYYFVVWRAFCTKRVKRDYFYLDYSFWGSARLPILTSMRLSRRSGTWKIEPEVWTIGVLQTIPFPALGATSGPRGGAADAKKRNSP